ncbi:MAG: hypothetical protein EPN97_04555 [Alphaproteobacteria bacterium]|nr:MAG: hypothetical protein EPN97_04555 [Alphaproteobacteria bacterium]
MMTLDEFREHVDIYSADLSRWPQDKLKPALQMVRENTAAKEYFDAALALDSKLRAYVPKTPALPALEDRILKGISTPQAASVRVSDEVHIRSAWIFAPGGGLLAAAILGFIIGLTPPSQTNGDTLVDPVYYAQDQIIGGDTDDDDDMGEVF